MDKINIDELAFEKAQEFIEQVASDELDRNVKEAERQSFVLGFKQAFNELGVEGLVRALVEVKGYINTKRNIFKEQYPEDEPHNTNNKLESINNALRNAGFDV